MNTPKVAARDRGWIVLAMRWRGLTWALPMTLLAAAPPVLADAVYMVNTTADLIDDNTDDAICHTSANTCSLRAAIMQANHLLSGGSTSIRLPAGTFTLTRPINGPNGEDNGDLNLTLPNTAGEFIAITGAGARNTIIDGNQIDGVFTIEPTRSAGIAGVTIRNGLRQGSGSGGGIKNRGSLVVLNCVIEDNSTLSGGGGIFNESLLNVIGSTISANHTAGDGGGIFSSGTLLVSFSTVRANMARDNFGQGGGLYLSGTSSIRNSSIYSNAASTGGGVLTIADLTIVNSTIGYNRADVNGAGLFNFGTTFMYSTTIVGNDADYDEVGGGTGGGVFADTTGGHRLVAVNSLIARNTLRTTLVYSECSGTLEVYGSNRLGDFNGCTFAGNGSAAVGVVSRSSFDALDDNGGTTLSIALLAGSQAIDATTTQGCIDETGNALTVDQRGAPRVAGTRCDIGAFEYGAVVDRAFLDGFE